MMDSREEAPERCQRDFVCYYCCVFVCPEKQGATVSNKYIHTYSLDRFVTGSLAKGPETDTSFYLGDPQRKKRIGLIRRCSLGYTDMSFSHGFSIICSHNNEPTG